MVRNQDITLEQFKAFAAENPDAAWDTVKNLGVYPVVGDVREGVGYGPTGTEYVGTLVVPETEGETPEGRRRNALRRMVGLQTK